ncbi:MAG: hypothetical protein NZM11_01885 [Anaerolineales bacterium]|nr:hypothetical protein [Anaerolineales bacterium]
MPASISNPQSQIFNLLFLFLDGVGLGADDPEHNPFVTAHLPNLTGLLNGRRLLAHTPRTESARALFLPTDACLGVAGTPQSATGQATILTGRNVPQAIGYHWGPKPNAAIAEIIRRESLFIQLKSRGLDAALLSAYPARYFEAIASGRRSYSAVPLAVAAAGLPLRTGDDLRAGRALAADFTNQGWHTHLGLTDVPLHAPREAGRRLAEAARAYPFAFFEHWLTDYAGHRGSLAEARALLETFDAVLGGLLEAWDDASGLIIITSDHGNIEDLSHRRHTCNPVPTFIIGGSSATRRAFADGLHNLADFAPRILKLLQRRNT